MRQTVVRIDRRVLATSLTLIAALAAMGGCGGGAGSRSTSTSSADPTREAALSPAVARRAEAICARATREIATLAARTALLMSREASAEEAITKGMVGPGIEVLEKEGRRLQALAPQVESAVFATYVGLFEPVLDLAYQRLAAGEAQRTDESHELEILTGSLTREQAKLAAGLGLTACETDFFEALGKGQ